MLRMNEDRAHTGMLLLVTRWSRLCPTYIHKYIRTYMHTYIHICIHICIHTYSILYCCIENYGRCLVLFLNYCAHPDFGINRERLPPNCPVKRDFIVVTCVSIKAHSPYTHTPLINNRFHSTVHSSFL